MYYEVFMGLDGISVNQLRITPENNSAELNNPARFVVGNEHKIVDGLSNSQKIDPDKEKDHQNPELARHYESDSEDESSEDENTDSEELVVKYNLSDSANYVLKLDEKSNNILIVDKSTSEVVQKIDADELSRYVGFLSNSQGSIINRKF